jgi:xylose isomerase
MNEQDYKYGVCGGLLGIQTTRWISYQPARNLEERFALASRITGLHGIELGYPADFQDRKLLTSLLKKYGFEVPAVNLKLRGPKNMFDGSFSSPEPSARADAVTWGREAMDAAADIGAFRITTCPLNDGMDYPFEMDYAEAWERLIEGFREVGKHRGDVEVCIEYKLSDPRTRSLVSNAGEALVLAASTGLANVGLNLDLGHSFIARENAALAAVQAAREKRLFYVHLNDNDRIADIDLVTGTVHYWETLEFLYWLKKLGYKGWLVTDVYPKGMDPAAVFGLTLDIHKRYVELAGKIDSLGLEGPMRKRDLCAVWEKIKTLIPSAPGL